MLFFVFGMVMSSLKAANVRHNWHWSFLGCWTLPCGFLFVNFSYLLFQELLRFCHFLVLASIFRFSYLSKKSYSRSKQTETSFPLWKTPVFVFGCNIGFNNMIKRSLLTLTVVLLLFRQYHARSSSSLSRVTIRLKYLTLVTNQCARILCGMWFFGNHDFRPLLNFCSNSFQKY